MWPLTSAEYGSASKDRKGAAFWAMVWTSRTNMIRLSLVMRLEISRLKSPRRSAKAARRIRPLIWTPPVPW